MSVKKYNSLEIEKAQQEFWTKNKTYSYDPSKSRQETFVIDTPPPTVSGSLHIGHVFSYTQTDVLARHQRMLGKNIFYPMGWDDNGLPTEKRIQNLYGIRCEPSQNYEPNLEVPKLENPKKHKGALKKLSRKNFLEVCHKQVQQDEKKYHDLWSHLGLSVDWNQSYETIGSHAQKISQKSFLDLYKKNLVENRFSPVAWDVTFQTAVAQADIEDRQKEGFYHEICFQVKEGAGSFIISTTRPELLAACIAVAAHPDDKRYQKFFGKTAITALFKAQVPIIPSDHADPTKGTGILMICTFGDMDDVRFWQKHSLDFDLGLKQIISKQGRLKKISFQEGAFKSLDPKKAEQHYQQIEGLKVHQARAKIAETLRKEKVLVGDLKPKIQFVKYYEKGDQPLELIATRQWFIKVLDYKQELIEYGKKITWHPESFFKRYEQWVSNLNQDWCISRQRFFGVPFPAWYPIDKNSVVNYQKILMAGDLPVDPIKTPPPYYQESQRGQAGGFVAEPDVMDTWASSSLTPFINSHWSYNPGRHKKLFPADLRPQAHEIIRTWAFYSIVKSYFHENSIPWKHIAISGWVVDPNKNKMSKSKGNIITPERLIETYSADAVRYWATKARLGQDTIYEEKVFKVGQKLITKIFNASNFVTMQLEGLPFSKNQWDKQVNAITEPVDKSWILKLETTVLQASQHLQNFEYAPALDIIEKTFWTFCDNYLELVKPRAYQLKNEAAGLQALHTLDYSLYLFLKLFAPYLPYITEQIWSYRYQSESPSIHTSKWPVGLLSRDLLEVSSNSLNLKDLIGFSFLLLEKIRNLKSAMQKSLVTEVSEIEICLNPSQVDLFKLCKEDILRAGHILEQGLTIKPSKNQEIEINLTLS